MSTVTAPRKSEQRLLEAARSGSKDAYAQLVDAHQAELHAHCYRMLGSLPDADDALQEALLRAWRGLARFEGEIWFRAWLYKICTNVCLNLIAKRPRRAIPLPFGTADWRDARGAPARVAPQLDAEVAWIDPYPDEQLDLSDRRAAPEARYEQREAVELGFIAALQHLPGRQRAVLILRDVLGFSAREVAAILRTTTVSVNSALQRARAAIDKRLPDPSQQACLRSIGDARTRKLTAAFLDAWELGDVDAMTSILVSDVYLAISPGGCSRGADAVEALLPSQPDGWRMRPIRASGQLAFAAYRRDPGDGCFRARLIDVITLRHERIEAIAAFADPSLFPHFALPLRLD
jgi:RNA polymerase sigma-70 factor (ECF subfamily)